LNGKAWREGSLKPRRDWTVVVGTGWDEFVEVWKGWRTVGGKTEEAVQQKSVGRWNNRYSQKLSQMLWGEMRNEKSEMIRIWCKKSEVNCRNDVYFDVLI
jgi:hypothetical protein